MWPPPKNSKEKPQKMRILLLCEENAYCFHLSISKRNEAFYQVVRYQIFSMCKNNSPIPKIANTIEINKSTMYRELKRNKFEKPKVYDPEPAQEKYEKRMLEKPSPSIWRKRPRCLSAASCRR